MLLPALEATAPQYVAADVLVEETEGVGEEVTDDRQVEEGERDADESVYDGQEAAQRSLRSQMAVTCKQKQRLYCYCSTASTYL